MIRANRLSARHKRAAVSQRRRKRIDARLGVGPGQRHPDQFAQDLLPDAFGRRIDRHDAPDAQRIDRRAARTTRARNVLGVDLLPLGLRKLDAGVASLDLSVDHDAPTDQPLERLLHAPLVEPGQRRHAARAVVDRDARQDHPVFGRAVLDARHLAEDRSSLAVAQLRHGRELRPVLVPPGIMRQQIADRLDAEFRQRLGDLRPDALERRHGRPKVRRISGDTRRDACRRRTSHAPFRCRRRHSCAALS